MLMLGNVLRECQAPAHACVHRDSTPRAHSRFRLACPNPTPTMSGAMVDTYRVFISSTYLDNVVRRKKVLDVIARAGRMAAVAMEHFTAEDRPTVKACRDRAADCELFVGIVAHRYGWEPEGQANGEEKSITWLEYEAARAARRPCLMFVIEKAVPFTEADLDPGPDTWKKREKLDRFKARMRRTSNSREPSTTRTWPCWCCRP